MRRRLPASLIVGAALALASSAHAQDREAVASVRLERGRLDAALRTLAAQSGAEILFAPDIVGERPSPRVVGRMSVEQALQLLLDGSGLSFRRTPEGTITIASVPPGGQDALAVPEILVVGRRTQNTDIRRTENDIQPYQVATARDIQSSHADNVDQFLRMRLASNAQPQAPTQDPVSELASQRSQVNLHGLGANQTLILIDGARLPGLPPLNSTLDVHQPDLNGIPVFAIDRIEALTGTAGGIYGPGATGGVINVILKRDYRGADLGITYGLSDRGDAARRRVDGRLGFTPDHGRTNMMIAFSHSRTDALPFGGRRYAVEARQTRIDQDADDFVRRNPTANAVLVRGLLGDDLSLKPAFGGGTLRSPFTYLPIGYPGLASDGGATLLANAGKVPSALAPDSGGVARSTTGSTSVTSLLLNLRHDFGAGLEAFVDVIGFDKDGRAVQGVDTQNIFIRAADPINPFTDPVQVTIPLSGYKKRLHNRLRSARLSTGLIARLPHLWKAEANVGLGRVRNTVDQSEDKFRNNPILLKVLNGGAELPVLDPFGDWEALSSAVQAYNVPGNSRTVARSRSRDLSLRLAGPLLTSRAGPVSLTLLAEHRREHVDDTLNFSDIASAPVVYAGFEQTLVSAYGELRAPIVPRNSGVAALRGLELQLAVRHDQIRSRLPIGPAIAVGPSDKITVHQAATAYTGGLRVFPYDWLMLRASIATGILPPTPNQLRPDNVIVDFPAFPDPRRGGRLLGSEGPFTWLQGGSPRLRPETARTLSFGLVVNPEDPSRPRFSVDVTHIDKRNEIGEPFPGGITYILNNDNLFPGRIERAPLTAADSAAGFTGGVVTAVDDTRFNLGRTVIEAVDLRADHAIRFGGGGVLRLYGAATWQPRLSRRAKPGDAAIGYIDFADGPLRWRGNAGIDWENGPFAIGVNGQYYGRYRAVSAGNAMRDDPTLNVRGVRIRPQFYLDLSTAYRIDMQDGGGLARSLELRLGIQNLFDHSPPIATNTDYGYSFYGDPRRRRFEVNAIVHF